MKNPVIQKILLSALTASFLTLPAHAYEERYGIKNSINAGFRLSVPFGPTKRNEDKVKYGLQLSFRREFNDGNGFRTDGHMAGLKIYNSDIMSLNFSENGFKSVSFAGQDQIVFKDGKLLSGHQANMNDVSKGILIGAGGIIILAGVGLGVLLLSVPSD